MERSYFPVGGIFHLLTSPQLSGCRNNVRGPRDFAFELSLEDFQYRQERRVGTEGELHARLSMTASYCKALDIRSVRRRQELFLGKRQRHPNFKSTSFTMVSLTCTLLVAFAASALASPVADPHAAPAVTPAPAPEIVKRATSCTFSGSNGASSASKSQKSCSTIVLSAIAVPSGTTLDLSDLPDDTTVR
jgi:hypothetical protein